MFKTTKTILLDIAVLAAAAAAPAAASIHRKLQEEDAVADAVVVPPEGAIACVYTELNFGGTEHCFESAGQYPMTGTDWGDNLQSMQFGLTSGNYVVQIISDDYVIIDGWVLENFFEASNIVVLEHWKLVLPQLRIAKLTDAVARDILDSSLPDMPDGAVVCIYIELAFKGERICYDGRGTHDVVGTDFDNSLLSIQFAEDDGEYLVRFFSDESFEDQVYEATYTIPYLSRYDYSSFAILYNQAS